MSQTQVQAQPTLPQSHLPTQTPSHLNLNLNNYTPGTSNPNNSTPIQTQTHTYTAPTSSQSQNIPSLTQTTQTQSSSQPQSQTQSQTPYEYQNLPQLMTNLNLNYMVPQASVAVPTLSSQMGHMTPLSQAQLAQLTPVPSPLHNNGHPTQGSFSNFGYNVNGMTTTVPPALQQHQHQMNEYDHYGIGMGAVSGYQSTNIANADFDQQMHAQALQNAHAQSMSQEMDDQKANLYKTEMCRKWESTGTCRYGSKCQFAHGIEELRTLVRHPLYKTTMCKSFQATGACRYGARCRFIHDESQYQLQSVPRANLSHNANVSQATSGYGPYGTKLVPEPLIQQEMNRPHKMQSHSSANSEFNNVNVGSNLGAGNVRFENFDGYNSNYSDNVNYDNYDRYNVNLSSGFQGQTKYKEFGNYGSEFERFEEKKSKQFRNSLEGEIGAEEAENARASNGNMNPAAESVRRVPSAPANLNVFDNFSRSLSSAAVGSLGSGTSPTGPHQGVSAGVSSRDRVGSSGHVNISFASGNPTGSSLSGSGSYLQEYREKRSNSNAANIALNANSGTSTGSTSNLREMTMRRNLTTHALHDLGFDRETISHQMSSRHIDEELKSFRERENEFQLSSNYKHISSSLNDLNPNWSHATGAAKSRLSNAMGELDVNSSNTLFAPQIDCKDLPVANEHDLYSKPGMSTSTSNSNLNALNNRVGTSSLSLKNLSALQSVQYTPLSAVSELNSTSATSNKLSAQVQFPPSKKGIDGLEGMHSLRANARVQSHNDMNQARFEYFRSINDPDLTNLDSIMKAKPLH